MQHKGASKTFRVPESKDILSASIEVGIDLPHDCKVGSCLVCPSKIISGIVDQSRGNFDDKVTKHGYALTCISFPKSDIIIQSLDEDDRLTENFSSYISSVYDSWRKK